METNYSSSRGYMRTIQFCKQIACEPNSRNPRDVLSTICQAWLDLSSAISVRMYVRDRNSNILMFVTGAYSADLAGEQSQPITNESMIEGLGKQEELSVSVSELPCGNPSVTIPFFFQRLSREQSSASIGGALRIILKNSEDMSELLCSLDLKQLTQLTEMKVTDTLRSHFLSILGELSLLSRHYVPRVAKSPDEDRVNYLCEVAGVIKRVTQAASTTFFYRHQQNEGCITCLYTDGSMLLGEKKVKLRREEIVQLDFVGIDIGDCIRLGSSKIVFPGEVDESVDVLRVCDSSGRIVEGPAFMSPIPTSSEQAINSSGPKADGVIHCAFHAESKQCDNIASIGPLESLSIEFIAEQISPVLALLATRRQREWEVSVIKHDLETPIAMISDTVHKLVSRRQISSDSGDAPEDLLLACQLIRHLTDGLNFGASSLELRRKPTCLRKDIMDRSIQILRHFALNQKDMGIEYDGFDDFPTLMIDPILTERAIYNIVTNAVKYGNDGTTVEIVGGKTDSSYFIDVSNYGLGIPESDTKMLFTRYFRSARARRENLGVGIGLHMAKSIMELQNGDITLIRCNEPTVFRISFPLSANLNKTNIEATDV